MADTTFVCSTHNTRVIVTTTADGRPLHKQFGNVMKDQAHKCVLLRMGTPEVLAPGQQWLNPSTGRNATNVMCNITQA